MLETWTDRIFALLLLALVGFGAYALFAIPSTLDDPPDVAADAAEPQVDPLPGRPQPIFPAGYESDPGYARALSGFEALRASDPGRAVPELETAVELSPGNAAWRFLLSDAYRALGDERLARETARQAQDLLYQH